MKWYTLGTGVLLATLLASSGLAQCKRSGGNRSTESLSAGSFSMPLRQNVYLSPENQTLTARQIQAQRLQQQRRFASAPQQRGNTPRPRQRNRSLSSNAFATNRTNSRRARLRQQNAEKALALAVKAADNGQTSTAAKYYRRAIRIAGPTAEISTEAQAAIASLATPQNSEDTDSDDTESLTALVARL